jgi:hypothetical protein
MSKVPDDLKDVAKIVPIDQMDAQFETVSCTSLPSSHVNISEWPQDQDQPPLPHEAYTHELETPDRAAQLSKRRGDMVPALVLSLALS